MKNTEKMQFASKVGIASLVAAIIFTGAVLFLTGCPSGSSSSHGDVTVSLLEIHGITIPVEDETPAVKITETEQYTGTVKWAGELIRGKFKANTVYTAIITMSPKPGYTFTGVKANTFTVDGSTEVYHENDLRVVTAEFPITGDKNRPVTINQAAIGGVTAPAANANPATAITATGQYTGTIRWSPAISAGGQFAYSTAYTAIITLTPTTGYTLTGVPEDYFTVVGAKPVSYSAGSNTVIAEFPATASNNSTTPIPLNSANVIGGVTPPVEGKRAVTSIPDHVHFVGAVTWSPALVNGLFVENTIYTATITLIRRTGFIFDNITQDALNNIVVNPNDKIVSGATSITNTAANNAANLTVTATFPVTGFAPKPAISLSPLSVTIPTVEKGYNTTLSAEFTVINTGNVPVGPLTIELGGTDMGSFTLPKDSINSLEDGDQNGVKFEVQVGSGLGIGVYECTVTVKGNVGSINFQSAAANIRFEVVGAKFTITNVPPEFKVAGAGKEFKAAKISAVIDNIKGNAGAEPIIIYFGDDNGPLNLGNSTINFEGPNWPDVTLQGNVTAAFPDNANGTINVGEEVNSLKSSANITTTAKSEQSSAFFNRSDGEVRITGGYIRAEDGTAVRHAGSGDLIIGGDALIEAKTNRGIDNLGGGIVEIGKARVVATTGRAVNNNADGQIRIKAGSEIESGTGTAVYNTIDGQIFIEGGTITSKNTTTSLATIVLMGPTKDAYYNDNDTLLTITGGTVKNTADGGKAVYNNTHDGVEISGGAIEAFGAGSIAVYNAANGKLDITGDATVDVGSGVAVYNAMNSENVIIAGNARIRATTGIAVRSTRDKDTGFFVSKITVAENAVISSANKNKLQGTIYLTNGSAGDTLDVDIEQLCINGGWVTNNIDGNAIYNEKDGIVNVGYYDDDPGVEENVGTGRVSAVSGVAINNARDGAVRIYKGNVYATAGGKAVLISKGDNGGLLYITGGDVWTENGGVTIDSSSDALDYDYAGLTDLPAVYIAGANVYSGTFTGAGTSTGRAVWIHNAAFDPENQGKLAIGGGSRIWSNNPVPADGTIYLETTGNVLISGGEIFNPVDLGNAIFNVSEAEITITNDAAYDPDDPPPSTKVWATSGVALFKQTGGGDVFINGLSDVWAGSGKAVYNAGDGDVTIGDDLADDDAPLTKVHAGDKGIAVHNNRNDADNTGDVLITKRSKVWATGTRGIAITSSSRALITVSEDALVTSENVTNTSGLALGTIVIEDDYALTSAQGNERLLINVGAGRVENTGEGVAVYNNSFGKITVNATFEDEDAPVEDLEEHVVSWNGKTDQGTIVLAKISKSYPAPAGIMEQLDIQGGSVVNNNNFGNAIYNDSRGHVITSTDAMKIIKAIGVRGVAVNNMHTGDVRIQETLGKTTVLVTEEDGTAIRNVSTGNVSIGPGNDNWIQSDKKGGIAIDNLYKGNVEIRGKVTAEGAGGLGVQNHSTGSVTIGEGGNITAGTGSGVLNNSLGKVIVSGTDAVITSNGGAAIQNLKDGSVEISGGTITATGTNGIAVVNAADGKVRVFGADMKKISSENINSSQGTIFFKEGPGTSGATLSIEADFGGEITNDAAAGTGNAIFNGADSEISILCSGGNVKKPNKGYAVYNKSSTAIVIIELDGLDPNLDTSINGSWDPPTP